MCSKVNLRNNVNRWEVAGYTTSVGFVVVNHSSYRAEDAGVKKPLIKESVRD